MYLEPFISVLKKEGPTILKQNSPSKRKMGPYLKEGPTILQRALSAQSLFSYFGNNFKTWDAILFFKKKFNIVNWL